MTLFELLALVVILSAGHFLGCLLEAKMGIGGWFGGCVLGIGISVIILGAIARLGKHSDKDTHHDASQ